MDDAPRSEGAGHHRPSYHVSGELPGSLRGLGAGVGPGGLGRWDETCAKAAVRLIPSDLAKVLKLPG